MAQQGNYVTVPNGSAPSPFKGLSSALAGVSEMYAGKAERDEAKADREETRRENRRRWDTEEKYRAAQDARQALIADRNTEEYNKQQATEKWIKGFGDIYDLDKVRIEKLKTRHGLTDKQIAEKRDQLDLSKVRVNREDIERFYGKEFTRLFGKALNSDPIKSYYSGIKSLAERQAAENKRTENMQQGTNKLLDYQIEAAKALLSKDGSKGSSSYSTSTGKLPKSHQEILIAPLVKDFDVDEGWLGLKESEKASAQEVGNDVVNSLKDMGADPVETLIVAKYALDRLRTGPSLTEIKENADNIGSLIRKGLQDYRENESQFGKSRNSSSAQFLQRIASGELLKGFSPIDVDAKDYKETQAYLDKVYGRSPKTPSKNVLAKASSQSNKGIEQKIIRNLGISKATESPKTPKVPKGIKVLSPGPTHPEADRSTTLAGGIQNIKDNLNAKGGLLDRIRTNWDLIQHGPQVNKKVTSRMEPPAEFLDPDTTKGTLPYYITRSTSPNINNASQQSLSPIVQDIIRRNMISRQALPASRQNERLPNPRDSNIPNIRSVLDNLRK